MIQSLKCRIGLHKFVLNDKFLIWWRRQQGINARVPDNLVHEECVHCHTIRLTRLDAR